jgi:hypothetical protein
MEQDRSLDTARQYDAALALCADIFTKKTTDYGTAWRVLRNISIVDQIYIKAQRLRTIQEKGAQRVEDDVRGEFIGIVNYSIIGNIQMSLSPEAPEELTPEHAAKLYAEQAYAGRELMEAKNHDYGEAWRSMSQESFVDLILMKLMRVKQIITNKGETIISEGIDANYADIMNYALFALIKIDEAQKDTPE